LGGVADQLGEALAARDADGHRDTNGSPNVVADRLRGGLQGEAARRHRPKEELVDGVVFDLIEELADDPQHQPGENLIPAEVPLQVDALRALPAGLPDGFAGLHPGRLYLVALGDDAGALVAEDAHRLAAQERVADPFGGHVKRIGVEVPDHGGSCSGGGWVRQAYCTLVQKSNHWARTGSGTISRCDPAVFSCKSYRPRAEYLPS